jgi:hypothetical protein
VGDTETAARAINQEGRRLGKSTKQGSRGKNHWNSRTEDAERDDGLGIRRVEREPWEEP